MNKTDDSTAAKNPAPAANADKSARDPVQPAAEPGSSAYGNYHSGRRAAGHGGGSLDRPTVSDGTESEEPGYAHSGGGQGHAAQASQRKENREDLESRSGPYTRSSGKGNQQNE